MRVNDDYTKWNAAAQAGDADSVHAFWKHAIEVRKQHDVLVSQRSAFNFAPGRPWNARHAVRDVESHSVLCVEGLETRNGATGKKCQSVFGLVLT